MDKEELLKVLDMSEEDQWVFCAQHCKKPIESLADLAFRLRDEVLNKVNGILATHALQVVYFYVSGIPSGWTDKMVLEWFSFSAKPIHWIIAALIAKGD